LATSNRFPHLLSPGKIGPMALRNRIAVTAMGVSLSEEDASVGERLIAYHEEQAKGGSALIILGASGVAWPIGCVTGSQTAISEDRFIPGLAALADRVHAHGAKVAAQLHHGGLVAGYSARWGHPLWAPAMPKPPKGNFTDYFLMEEFAGFAGMKAPTIKVLEPDDIALVIEQFGQAARRAREAGLDGIEIHAGHGYLLSSFISPYTNNRTDEFGGSLENRMRLPLAVLRAVLDQAGPDMAVWVKLDSREIGKPGGITIDDAKTSAKMLEAAGAHAITVSAYHDTGVGKLHSESNIPHIEEANLPATDEIGRALSIPVIGLGRIDVDAADRAIGQGRFDFVAMGRKLLADPDLPRKLTQGDADKVRPCIYCYTCVSAIYTGESARCAVNPETGFEYLGAPPRGPMRHVAVIGGGPGGMEAARRLRMLGHKVTLLEKSNRLGGTLRFAALAYEPNERILDWLQSEIAESDITVQLGVEATPAMLTAMAVDHVIVATGAVRGMPPIPGHDHDNVYSGDDMRALVLGQDLDALKRKTGLFTRLATKMGAATGMTANLDFVRKASRQWMPLGKRIVIIGGELVGIELAEFLHERGRIVTVVDEAPRLGKGLTLVRRMRILQELAEHGVALHAGAKDIAIVESAVTFTASDGTAQSVPADHVIVAKGARGDLSLAQQLVEAGFDVRTIGDANGVGYIEGAIRGAAHAVRALAEAQGN
jgi:2,4-dienoyl-CoA reductase-like NADH-dependent reductase (Old Yellow Enzyme family)/NADPH-dependent 2,4-dienoyl-CoA reductase/sulfur reductase-like enzyme